MPSQDDAAVAAAAPAAFSPSVSFNFSVDWIKAEEASLQLLIILLVVIQWQNDSTKRAEMEKKQNSKKKKTKISST